MKHPPVETTLHSYLEELVRQRRMSREAARTFEHEFAIGLRSIHRYRYTAASELFAGDGGIEVLHDVLANLLSGEIGAESGDVLRAMSRAAYDLFRRGRLGRKSTESASETELRESVEAAKRAAPQEVPAAWDELDAGLTTLIDEVDAHEHQKRRGGVHLARLAGTMQVTPRMLRRRLDQMAAMLGRDEERNAFWVARLGEAFVALLQDKLEASAAELVPSAPLETRSWARARDILARLKYVSFSRAARAPIREARSVVMRRCADLPTLRRIAIGLGGDPFAIGIVDAEHALIENRVDTALERLDDVEAVAGSSATRRQILLRIARARGLAAKSRLVEAAEQLEVVASVQRGDAILSYNRFVLARRTANSARELRSRRDLEQLVAGDAQLRPLLRQRIRRALAQ